MFNVYLDEALRSNKLIDQQIKKGKILAYADDIAIMSRDKKEASNAIKALEKMGETHNLHLNKKNARQ